MSRSQKITKGIQAVLLAVMLVVSLLAGSSSSALAQAGAPQLFTDAVRGKFDQLAPDAAYVHRSRLVRINTSALFDSSGAGKDTAALPEVVLNIFPDATYTGVVNKVEKTSDTTTWIGTLKGIEGSYFYLVASEGALIVHVGSLDGIYEVSSAAGTDGLYKAIQIDQSKYGEDYPIKLPPPGPVLSTAELGPNADSGATIDVMILYTTAARVAEGSSAAMKARVALGIAESNQAYANAGVTPRLRLVHTEEVAYTESGDIGTDVARLAGKSDGYMDNIHAIRDTYAADMVSLVVDNGGGYCGVADAIMATATTAFQVTARDCMTGYYSLSHEFGHLQGARHDRYVDPTNTPYTYGHGYTYPAASWRTIMAYNDACSAVGKNCTRLQYFSNPAVTHGGVPMGTSTYNKVFQVLNNTAATVANFRTAKIGANFSSSFDGTAPGWTPVNGAWAFSAGKYYYTGGVVNSFASIVHSSTYGDLTYQVTMKRTGSLANQANNIVIRGNSTTRTAANDWKLSYRFGYTNDGHFAVFKINSTGVATALKGWTASAAIVKGGWNTLKVIAVGSTLRFYINNVSVWSGADSSFRTGQVGVQMYRASGTTGNNLYVDSASLSTTPTADMPPSTADTPADPNPGGSPAGYNVPMP